MSGQRLQQGTPYGFVVESVLIVAARGILALSVASFARIMKAVHGRTRNFEALATENLPKLVRQHGLARGATAVDPGFERAVLCLSRHDFVCKKRQQIRPSHNKSG